MVKAHCQFSLSSTLFHAVFLQWCCPLLAIETALVLLLSPLLPVSKIAWILLDVVFTLSRFNGRRRLNDVLRFFVVLGQDGLKIAIWAGN